MSTRYYIYSKTSKTQKAIKNAATREEARDYKRNLSNPTAFGIMDRQTGESIR